MQKWRYYGYCFSKAKIEELGPVGCTALDAVAYIEKEYPDTWHVNDVFYDIVEAFKEKYPAFNHIDGELEHIE